MTTVLQNRTSVQREPQYQAIWRMQEEIHMLYERLNMWCYATLRQWHHCAISATIVQLALVAPVDDTEFEVGFESVPICARSSVVERCPDKTEVESSILSGRTNTDKPAGGRFSDLCEAERCEPSRANPEPGSRKIRCDGDGFICDHKAMAQKISLTTSTPRRKSRGLASPALRMLDQRSVRSPCSERSGPTPGTTPRIR